MIRVKILTLLLLLLVVQQGRAVESGDCADHNPLRTAYFGDLHVHTSLSLDASMQDTRTRPADAYRYARGEAIAIPPYDNNGVALRQARISRPLDFAAVTDHAELLGENRICHNKGMSGYWSLQCMALRWIPRWGGILLSHTASKGQRAGFCSDDGEPCLRASEQPWQEIIEAAETANHATGDCSFSSFIGYEWTGASYPESGVIANLHRNVIFRNSKVPSLPISFIDRSDAMALYRALDADCAGGGEGCDALVIPHNSNISLGLMFDDTLASGKAITESDAVLRARYETLAEIVQHKGASECYFNAASPLGQDELCGFEQLPWNSFSGNTVAWLRKPIEPTAGLLREALQRGLQHDATLGANPFQFGFIGSTDSHRSLSGGVEEYDYQGHGGAGNAGVTTVAAGLPDQWEFNPGGLAVLYAEQNSRDALFDAMRRREAYATSGPRIRVRLFGGKDIPLDLCRRPDFLARGYRQGVPMGGELSGPMPSGAVLRFAVAANKDAGIVSHPGTDLQRVQIIKGWIDATGQSQQRVYDVAGDADNGASVDLATCETRGNGFASLCTVWQDPSFDPGERAFYYARVIENPSCRWSTRICNGQKIDCSKADDMDKDAAICCSSELTKTIQERAWTSPIWYTP